MTKKLKKNAREVQAGTTDDPPLQHAKWEATLRNLRALKKDLADLEDRVGRLERQAPR